MTKATMTMTAPHSSHAHSAGRAVTRMTPPAFPITATRLTAVTDSGSAELSPAPATEPGSKGTPSSLIG